MSAIIFVFLLATSGTHDWHSRKEPLSSAKPVVENLWFKWLLKIEILSIIR